MWPNSICLFVFDNIYVPLGCLNIISDNYISEFHTMVAYFEMSRESVKNVTDIVLVHKTKSHHSIGGSW